MLDPDRHSTVGGGVIILNTDYNAENDLKTQSDIVRCHVLKLLYSRLSVPKPQSAVFACGVESTRKLMNAAAVAPVVFVRIRTYI